jgi:UDP-2,3-diacylglucosamine pyrophosphatase LpxH
MLVMISDLHVTDESTSRNVNPKALNGLFLREIVRNARANAREIRFVLLGDIFDLVRSDYWVKGVPAGERPWNGSLSSETGMNTHPNVEAHYAHVLDGVCGTRAGKALFKVINTLKRRSSTGAKRKIFTKITFVSGNHDRAINAFPSLQNKIRDFIDDVDEVEFLTGVEAPEYGVLARHGHEWDEQCYGYDLYTKVLRKGSHAGRFDGRCYNVQSIGEVVTAELLAGFIARLQQQLGSTDPEFVRELMEINNVRPQIDAFWWLEWFGRKYLDSRKKELLLQAVKESIAAVLNSTLARRWDELVTEISVFRGDLTDRLDQLLAFIGKKPFDDLKFDLELFQFFKRIFASAKDEFVEGARREWDFGLPDEIQYVVYGHTHEARNDYFSGLPDGKVKMYINTGTYLPLIQRARDSGFATANQLTMSFFYRGDEDRDGKKGDVPSMEIWNGIKRKAYP